MNEEVQQLLDLLAPAVLLDIKKGTKAPRDKNWQEISLEDMSPLYLRRLQDNIGVSLGSASDELYSIDCDEEATFMRLLELNPSFADTLQSHGRRGGNFWLRIEGEAPKTGHYFRLPKGKDSRLGEWRGTGAQTVIYGKHPEGMDYRNNGKRPITIKFSDIHWPDDWWLPWQHREETSATSKEGQSARQSKDQEVVETMLMSIPPRPDYDLWLKISAAVRNSLGNDERAIEKLKVWSPEETEGEYAKLLSSSNFSEITFGTLLHHAAENGYSGAVRRFFYSPRGFGMQTRNGYVPLTGADAVKQHLAKLGVPRNAINNALCDIRETRFVDYIGPLGGHMPGVRTFSGSKMVVTSAPTIVEAVKGNSPFLELLIENLLFDPQQPQQLNVFLDWLAHCRNAVLRHQRVQTPALALCGSKGDGKSLLIEVVRRVLGGRAACGYDFLSGQKGFNGELAGVEVVTMDDVPASKDHRSRVRLAQSLKSNLFASGVRIEAKNRDPIYLDPVQAVVIALNCDPEELRVLPELMDSMEDKIILLKTRPATFHGTMEENSAAIDRDLPDLLHCLETRDLLEAYGPTTKRLKCFWHPEVIEALSLLSAERQLLELAHQHHTVREAIREKGMWRGTATELEAALTDSYATTQHQARRLLSWGGACGAYLGRLADAGDQRVHRDGLTTSTRIQQYRIVGVSAAAQLATKGGRGGEETISYLNSKISPPISNTTTSNTPQEYPPSLLASSDYSETWNTQLSIDQDLDAAVEQFGATLIDAGKNQH